MTPPSGAVSFLFTDVEGSTRLWQSHVADQARALLADTWSAARSPNTMVLLMEAYERSQGITESTPRTRSRELARRVATRDVVTSEGRCRLAIEAELARLDLTKSSA